MESPEVRSQLMSWVFMTHGASDHVAAARGSTWGMAAELYWEAGAVRVGRFAPPKESNGLSMDFKLWHHYGDNLEIERDHAIAGRPGKLRIMGFHNHARLGAFADAVGEATQDRGPVSIFSIRVHAEY